MGRALPDLFELWRREGLLAPVLPVCHWGEKGVAWAGRLQALVHACSPQASELVRACVRLDTQLEEPRRDGSAALALFPTLY